MTFKPVLHGITATTALQRAHRGFLFRRVTSASFLPVMDMSTEVADRKGSVKHDTHATPPHFVQKEHWRYQSMRKADLENDPDVYDLSRWEEFDEKQKATWRPAGTIPAARIEAACQAYAGGKALDTPAVDAPVYENRDFPGLSVVCGLLPPETQVLFTSCLMHRDLADPGHKINLQSDYEIPYPPKSTPQPLRFESSFFLRERSATEDSLKPFLPDKHKILNNEQALYTKLRWLTLGEQYDWPTRSYAKHSTPFPKDLSTLVTGLFPHIRPESGVVLIYSAKDFMPVHRDVSEQCQRALASFSVGCDGIFIMARGEDDGEGEDAPRTVAIRVKSGDCVHLSGQARWAWHAMARTIPSTCPPHLASWPVGTPGSIAAEEKAFKKWKGYMGTKRINVSCRQVWD
ncbi:oxidoreductase domain-containing protein [Paraphoma chrysanthemicola]|nr:oxidoreductase domain-containing protein [Paraphoma chrysanthemicola]